MKRVRFLLPLLAVILAVAASAFTSINAYNSDLVWFELDPQTGAVVNSSQGYRGQQPPGAMNCGGADLYCSKALSLQENEVVPNGDGTYSIASGVQIEQDFNDEVRKD